MNLTANNTIELESNNSIEFDVAKHGFSLFNTGDTGCLFFRRQFKWFYVELMVSANVYSLYRSTEDRDMVIANRYKIDTQEQLDFLILNGRVGEFFSEVTM